MSQRHLRLRALAIACALLLAACGGGGGDVTAATDPPASGSDVPASAGQSAAGAFEFVQGVAASASETEEPLRLGEAPLATSETDEPRPL